MGSNIWKIAEVLNVLLDESDVIEGLAKKLHNVEFTSETDDSVYPVEVERTDFDKLVIIMSDGTEFILSCKKKGD